MSRTFIDLSPGETLPPALAADGLLRPSDLERQRHGPDCTVLLVEDGVLRARCSCWWSRTPMLEGQTPGVIGHYAATTTEAGAALLARACDLLAAQGCTVAVGPMDGNTWRSYRFIVERGDEPTFFLEPDQPDDWPGHWAAAGFTTLATYTSALTDDLLSGARDDARRRLEHAGIAVRPLETSRAADELRRIYALSLEAFSRNFLYTPITESEFVAQYQAVLPHVRPELVLLAENDGALAGFLFAVPDLLQARRGRPVDTVIVKTLAVEPALGGRGVGGALVAQVHERAHALGYRRAIHALIHETNLSRRISDRHARTMRRYALYSRPLNA